MRLIVDKLEPRRVFPPNQAPARVEYLKSDKAVMPLDNAPTFLSLFSGCGGLDLGFQDAGFRCVGAFDISQAAISVHNANLGRTGHVVDLRVATPAQLASAGRPTVVVAGSPCQGFSTVGKRDLNDPRNSLLLTAGEVAVQLKPRVFVAENVAGALSGDHKVYWDSVEHMLRGAGYATTTLRLNAQQLGLAQKRPRAILLAWLSPTEPRCPEVRTPPADLRRTLQGVELASHHVDGQLEPTPRHLSIASHIQPGQKLSNVRTSPTTVHTWSIPSVFGKTSARERLILESLLRLRRRDRQRDWGDADPVLISTLSKEVGFSTQQLVQSLIARGYLKRKGHSIDLANTFNGLYRRLRWDSVAPTVDTKFGDMRFFLHPEEDRGFSVREAARIQGFPDSFKFSANKKESFTMIGNAVPPPMGRHIALTALSLIGR